jgi:hypothetical protein
MDYIREAIEYLRHYNDLKISLETLKYEVMQIDAEIKSVKAIDYSGQPHGSGGKDPDDLLVNRVYRKQKAIQEIELTTIKVKKIDEALKGLSRGSDNYLQEEIVRWFYIDHKKLGEVRKKLQQKNIEDNFKDKELSDRQIYKIRDKGIKRMAIRFFGIKGFGD